MISLLIKHFKEHKDLKFSKGKGSFTIKFGFATEPDKSKQSTFKKWNEQIKRR
jgi:hypothetical protein|tara:strand:- start:739 stop:897 length:159 start_codon:yes stop_codon:yes gene_type:complete